MLVCDWSDWSALLMLADSHHAEDLVWRSGRVVREFDDQSPVVRSAGAVRLRYHVLSGEYELVHGLLLLLPPLLPRLLPLVSLAPLSLICVNALVGEAEIIIVIFIVVILVVREHTRTPGSFVRRLLGRGRDRNLEVFVPGLEDGGLRSDHILGGADININLVLFTLTVAKEEVSEQQTW